MSFYRDPKATWGSNNWLFPDVAMPNILANLQGEQIPFYLTETYTVNGEEQHTKVIDHLVLIHAGLMSPIQFAASMNDLSKFYDLCFRTDAHRASAHGKFLVLLFLVIFSVFAYLLKREFWRGV